MVFIYSDIDIVYIAVTINVYLVKLFFFFFCYRCMVNKDYQK